MRRNLRYGDSLLRFLVPPVLLAQAGGYGAAGVVHALALELELERAERSGFVAGSSVANGGHSMGPYTLELLLSVDSSADNSSHRSI